MKRVMLLTFVSTLLVGFGVIGIVSVINEDGSEDDSPPIRSQSINKPQPTAADLGYDLALVSHSCTRPAQQYIECEGFVTNVSGHSLENVTAVIIQKDAAGTPVASDYALIDYNPILAGQQSPWSVIFTDNPAYASYVVEFKDLLGPALKTDYSAVR